ncbi:DUF2062 domain-containing protein [Altericroceibacterium xinjiangense]|uniref:DUF2062 domain-containing protein n=1 Tax=Altericroceibacterium xinjiangense TaxID=762261 RepID=UPI000F7D704F|nr:DUF2062 domain-containing protein [Altericroceibacterium xinjiangense]
MKDRETILASRWLKPFAHLFGHPSLWHLNRRSFPRGLAIGLFVGFILPIGQFALAALLAVPLRANVPLSAAATLVSNPLTFPPIYFAAYQFGTFLLGHGSQVRDSAGWIATLLDVSAPTALGLLIFAVTASSLGYLLGGAWWRMRLTRRWNRRNVGRQSAEMA